MKQIVRIFINTLHSFTFRVFKIAIIIIKIIIMNKYNNNNQILHKIKVK